LLTALVCKFRSDAPAKWTASPATIFLYLILAAYLKWIGK